MKSGWVTKKLGEVCDSFNGIWKGVKPPFKTVGVIRATNFTKQCEFDSSKTVFIEVEEKKFNKRRLEFGDIIVERSGGGPGQPVGRVIFFNLDEGDYTISNFTSALRVKDKAFLSPYYLHRVLVAKYFSGATEDMQSNSIHIINLNYSAYLQLDIPIPPLAEQKRIVAKIDAAFEKIDKLKANAEKNLANAKDLFQSALDEAMRPKEGWVEKRLGEVCCKIGSGATPRGGKASYCQQGISLIRSMNVYDNSFVYSELAHISESQAKELANVTIEPCDVLINITGASVARCCVVPNDVIPARVNQHVSILRISSQSKLDPDFLCYSLVAPSKKRLLLGIGEAGSTRQALTKSDLSSFCISIPAVEEQKIIVKNVRNFAEKIKMLEQNYTQQIADCVEMRQAVLREAFEGRL